MELLAVYAAAVLLHAAEPPRRTSTGSLCLGLSVEPAEGQKSQANPSGGNPEPDHSIQLDGDKAVRVPRPARGDTSGVLIKGLSLEARHLVAVRTRGRVTHSFYFRFPPGQPRQCLFLEPLYLTWRLQGAERGPSCTCRPR
jgi:hypothetical protein